MKFYIFEVEKASPKKYGPVPHIINHKVLEILEF